MGSSGIGTFENYPGSKGQGGEGSPEFEDRCARAFATELEDVDQSSYFQAHRSLPPIGTELRLLRDKRVVAQTVEGETVGSVPTSLNYLGACLADGWSYVGTVTDISNAPPVAEVLVDFVPSTLRQP